MRSTENARYISSIFRQSTLIFLLLTGFCQSWAKAEMIDRVVAEVNNDVITLSELEKEGRPLFKKIAREVSAQELDSALKQTRRDVLASLIDKTLLNQKAAEENVSVSEAEIDAAMEQVLQANKLTREELLEQLEASGLDEAVYRDNLKSQILQNKLITRDISSKIVITDEMMLDVYDTSYTHRVAEGGYYLLQIGTSWDRKDEQTSGADDSDAKQAARQRIERVHKLALSGQDFRVLAKKFSDLPSASEGGDIGSFKKDELANYMKDAITDLKPGEISDIVETPVGFQFFKLLSSKEGGIVMKAPYESVKEEIKERLFREAMKKEYENWIKDLRQHSFIRMML